MQKQSHVERSFLNQIVKSKDPNITKFNFSKKSCNKPAIYFTQSSISPSSVVESALVKTNQFREVDRKHKSCLMCVQAYPCGNVSSSKMLLKSKNGILYGKVGVAFIAR